MKRLGLLDAIVAATSAGTQPVLVGRPRGVTHVYLGPLTRTGTVPTRHRPICNAHTRRLYDRSSFPVRGELLMCARCSARLVCSLIPRRAEHLPTLITSLADDRRRHRSLSVVDLYLSIRFAETEDELAECAVAMELGFTKEELRAGHQSPTGRTFSDLPAVLAQARSRLRPSRTPTMPAPYFRRPLQDPTYREAAEQAERLRHRPNRRIA
ncbi:MAG: hypothetical protein ABIN55_01780 [Aeromicrobium sp.]